MAVAASGLVLGAQAANAAPVHNPHHDPAVQQINLVSDVPGLAPLTDPDLVNPWGLAMLKESKIWTSNAGTDTSTLYGLAPGSTVPTKSTTVRVTLPGSPALPTGQVANNGDDFVLTKDGKTGPAQFVFATITGRIEAWNQVVDPAMGDAEIKATVPGAVYTGLALASGKHGDQLYAADNSLNRIDVFDTSFDLVPPRPDAFKDPHLPKGYAPFNITTLQGSLYVTYALPDPATGKTLNKPGLGIVDRFTPDGELIDRIATGETLNAPWGVAIAPSSWGKLAGSLLIGDFGDGRINVLPPIGHGRFAPHISGQLHDSRTGQPIAIQGLWALLQGSQTTGGTDSIWFSAGIDDEQHGLLGVLRP
jgi:uncharacterized protein (TIGR03118 family)